MTASVVKEGKHHKDWKRESQSQPIHGAPGSKRSAQSKRAKPVLKPIEYWRMFFDDKVKKDGNYERAGDDAETSEAGNVEMPHNHNVKNAHESAFWTYILHVSFPINFAILFRYFCGCDCAIRCPGGGTTPCTLN